MRTYGDLHFDGECWVINAEPHVMIKLKSVFPKIRKSSTTIRLEDTDDVGLDLDWFIQRYPLEVKDECRSRLTQSKNRYLAFQQDLERIMLPDYVPSEIPLKKALRPYQPMVVDLAWKLGNLLCGDDLGLGKTIYAIALAAKGAAPMAVVVQTHLVKQWKRRVEEFSDLKVHIIKTSRVYDLPPADVYIFTYGRIVGWVHIFTTGFFRACCFDEIQELRHPDTEKFRGARALTDNTKWQLGLSATPVWNYGNDIYTILNLLKKGCLGDWESFAREYLSGSERIVKDPKALGTYLRERLLFIRRTRDEVGIHLPPVNTIIHTVECNEDAYEDNTALARTLATTALHGSYMERGTALRELNIMVRHATGVSKAKGVAAYAKIFAENKEPIILVGWHRDVYDIWNKELAEYNPVMYTGSETPTQKDNAVKAFTSGESNIFIISLRSGAGLDGLEISCNTILFGELDWSPKTHEQLIGRIQRPGQQQQVMAVYLTCDEGSDPVIIELLGLKNSQSSGIVDPSVALQANYSDEARLVALAKKVLEKK